MDSFELNKILGAVLGTCTFMVAVNIAAEAIFTAEVPEIPGYEIAVREPAPTEANGEAPPKEVPIQERLAEADAERGEAAARKCAACHTFENGGANRVGPNLWGIVGRARASKEEFNYSAALEDKGGQWTIEELDKFLANPRSYIPGTSMTFAGISRARERADVIRYLQTLTDDPESIPEAADAPAGAKSSREDSELR